MADQPANSAPTGNAAPPPIHHEGPARRESPARRDIPAHRRADPPPRAPSARPLGAWALYLVLLAGVAAGLYITWQGSRYAARGTEVVGCSLLAAALLRLVLPPRYAGPLSSRRKTSDVLAFTAFGAGVLGVALMLP
jgi:Protein of unknown function (DUF3017)